MWLKVLYFCLIISSSTLGQDNPCARALGEKDPCARVSRRSPYGYGSRRSVSGMDCDTCKVFGEIETISVAIDSKIDLRAKWWNCNCKLQRQNWQIWKMITIISLKLLTMMINKCCCNSTNLEFCSISWWNIHSMIPKIVLNNL